MIAAPVRVEPSPYEEAVIASTLESALGQETLMEQIHRLNQERTQLQTRLARHPWGDREATSRIREISIDLETCWAEVRRERAARRVQIEEALGVDPTACEESPRRPTRATADDHKQQQARKRHRIPLMCAS